MTHSTTRDLVCKMPTAIAALRWTSTMSISIRRSDWIACCWADQLRMHSPLPIVWSKLQQPHCTNPSLPDWFRSTAIGCTIVPVFVCVCTIRMVCVRLPMKFYVSLFVCLECGVCVCVVFYCLVCGIHRHTHTHTNQKQSELTCKKPHIENVHSMLHWTTTGSEYEVITWSLIRLTAFVNDSFGIDCCAAATAWFLPFSTVIVSPVPLCADCLSPTVAIVAIASSWGLSLFVSFA